MSKKTKSKKVSTKATQKKTLGCTAKKASSNKSRGGKAKSLFVKLDEEVARENQKDVKGLRDLYIDLVKSIYYEINYAGFSCISEQSWTEVTNILKQAYIIIPQYSSYSDDVVNEASKKAQKATALLREEMDVEYYQLRMTKLLKDMRNE